LSAVSPFMDHGTANPHFSPPFSAIAPALLYLLHPCSRTAATQWLALPDFHSVRALNIV
jgi:hypothetical protein